MGQSLPLNYARQVNRIMPVGPASAYKTYAIRSPLATHYRDATCQEVECGAYAAGWITTVDVATPLGAKQANYIRLLSGRHFTVSEVGNLVSFTFPGGQRCFAEHKVPVGRPEFYVIKGGDWRGDPRRTPVEQHNADTWVDSFANHQDRLKTEYERG